VGLGSNLDSPMTQIDRAVDAIRGLDDVRVIAVSPPYRSAPMGPSDQPDYINAALSLLTTRQPQSLLAELLAIEAAQGRTRGGRRWGPRTIDLDLLVFGSEQIETPDLTLPHPGIAERIFVLLPLRDIAPHLRIPGVGTVARLAAGLERGGPPVERLEDSA
jgi:2-amino-4-hydroxy-6-hydroxymethyldihydropteridine diphosphokinase